MTAQRILIYIGPGPDDAIGENFMKLPMLRAIKATWPDAVVSWMAGEGPWMFDQGGILANLSKGLIDSHLLSTAVPQGFLSTILPNKNDFGGRFDLIIDTQSRPQRTLALRRIPHKTFISASWGFSFSDARPPSDAPKWNAASLAEKLLILHAAASGKWSPPDPVVPLPAAYYDLAANLLPSGPTYVGFAPGAGSLVKGQKIWPLEDFIATAKVQSEAGQQPVFFLGPTESHMTSIIEAALPGAMIAPTLATLPDGTKANRIMLTMALASRVGAVVSNCSGAGHMIAASGTAMVSLFGPTSPKKFRPYARSVTAICAQDFGETTMEAIPVQAVSDAINAAINTEIIN